MFPPCCHDGSDDCLAVSCCKQWCRWQFYGHKYLCPISVHPSLKVFNAALADKKSSVYMFSGCFLRTQMQVTMWMMGTQILSPDTHSWTTTGRIGPENLSVICLIFFIFFSLGIFPPPNSLKQYVNSTSVSPSLLIQRSLNTNAQFIKCHIMWS